MDFYSNNYDLLTGSERTLLHYIRVPGMAYI